MVGNRLGRTAASRRWARWGRSLLGVGAIALLWGAILSGSALPQTPEGAGAAPAPSPAAPSLLPDNPVTRPLQNLTPPNVTDLFQNASGPTADLASIYLDGRALYEVAAPTGGSALTAAQRAQEIEERLRRIAKPLAQPNGLTNLRVASAIDAESNQPIITVNDEILMTVTYLDARLNGSNSLTLRATEIVEEV
ncbi:MAG TPA: hypothetical protein V6D02_02365, partial [Candidatus Obscuribacterales bacterium]